MRARIQESPRLILSLWRINWRAHSLHMRTRWRTLERLTLFAMTEMADNRNYLENFYFSYLSGITLILVMGRAVRVKSILLQRGKAI